MSHDLDAIAAQLRRNGFRMTPQRQLILDAICELGGHVTPEEVVQRVQAITPALNRATVYRALNFLVEQRIITVTLLPDGKFVYELAEGEPHHHLVCRACGASVQLPHAALSEFYRLMEKQYDFRVDMTHISFFGLCKNCREGSA
ncbi:MAG: transcriptional repressor [Chloroflexi bacterium]|nr:transcriptional repressor [Chloroflexota bacterium]